MKLTIVLLLFFTFQVSANGYAQRVTIVKQNAHLTEIFKSIEQQTGYHFFYDRVLLKNTHPIDIAIRSATLDQALVACLSGQGLTYSLVKNTVVIRVEKISYPQFQNISSIKDIPVVVANIVQGRVTNSKREPLVGVSVTVKGTTTGTSSDAKGNYSIDVPANGTLVFSYVGFATNEIKVNNRSEIEVIMLESVSELDQVVVIGYGTRKRINLTGSVASISGKEIAETPTTNITNALAGLLPGVITKNTSGEPGRDNSLLLIRGSNTTGNTNPLVVVDGVQDVAGWERINANDIESISVLKDASAAIYGARAANGVILITTKRGITGKPVISYSYNQGISQPTRLPKMASSFQFAEYVNQLDVEAGNAPRYTDEMLRKFQDGSDPNYINENWYTESLKKNVPMSQQHLSVRGGSENIKYSVSGSYSNENGIFKNTSLNYKTYTVRSNIDAKINKWIKVGFDLNGALFDGNYPGGGSNFGSLKQIPFIPVFWPNGLPSSGIENGQNPIIQASEASGNVNNKENRYLAKASFDIIVPGIKGLGMDGYFVYTNNTTVNKNWQKPWTVYDYDKTTDTYIPKLGGGILQPQLTQTYSGLFSTLVNLRIKYNMQIKEHHFDAFVAVEQSNGLSNNFSAFRKNFISDQIDEIFAGSLVNQVTGGARSENGRENLFGRFSYNFIEKYLIDLTFRYDGSFAFPKGKQFGFFPGVSAAWRISQENFIKENLSFIDDLKLRGSYGQMGNDAIDPFQFLGLYTLGNTGMVFGQTQIATQGLYAGVTPNPNITWEVATSSNLGMDASFLHGLLGFEFDVFKQRRSHILATRNLAVPSFTGLLLPNENIGIVDNKGFEVQLFHKKTINNFSYRIAGNFAYNKSKIISIDEAQNVPEWQKAEGHQVGAQRFYQAIGILRTQAQMDKNVLYPGSKIGDLYYRDVDNNGVIDNRDMVMTDKTNVPATTFGANISASYRNFGIWANFAGATNYWQYYHVNARTAMNQLEDVIVNRYTPGSMDSKYPRLPTLETQVDVSGLNSNFWMRDASYVKLKTVELSYTLPENFLSKINVEYVKVYVNGNNLLTFDKLKWNDPENSSNTNGNYPQQKVFNLGLNLTF